MRPQLGATVNNLVMSMPTCNPDIDVTHLPPPRCVRWLAGSTVFSYLSRAPVSSLHCGGALRAPAVGAPVRVLTWDNSWPAPTKSWSASAAFLIPRAAFFSSRFEFVSALRARQQVRDHAVLVLCVGWLK